jgi:hypothetical protein
MDAAPAAAPCQYVWLTPPHLPLSPLQAEAGAQRLLRVPQALCIAFFLWLLRQSGEQQVKGGDAGGVLLRRCVCRSSS